MIVLGVILMVLGFFFGVPFLWPIGLVILVIGLVLFVLGARGGHTMGRRYWY